MKTLLINLPHHSTPFPLGMAYIAGALQHEVVGYDAYWQQLHQNERKSQDSSEWTSVEEEVRDLILSESPDMIGITLHQFTENDIIWIKRIRDYHKGIIIAGGGSVSIPAYGLDVLKKTDLDIVVCGDGEQIIQEIESIVSNNKLSSLQDVRGICYKTDNGIKQTAARMYEVNIDRHFPNRNIFPGLGLNGESYKEVTMYTSRGCFWNCSYCSVTNISRNLGVKGRRSQSAKRVIEELDQISSVRAIEALNFFDDDFLGLNKYDYERAIDIIRGFNRYKELKRVFFETTPRAIVNSYKNNYELWELIRAFQEAGVEIVISLGVESMSPTVLQRMGKKTNCDLNLEAASIVREYASENSTFTYIMYLDHKISLYELKETMNGFYDILSILPNAPHKDLINKTMIPTPGSNIWDELKAEDNLLVHELPVEIGGYKSLTTYRFQNDDVAKAYLLIEYFKDSLDILYKSGMEMKGILNYIIENAPALDMPASDIMPIGVFFDMHFKRGFMSKLKSNSITKNIQALIKESLKQNE